MFLSFIAVILFVHEPGDGESALFDYLPFIWGAAFLLGLAAFAAFLFDLHRNPRVAASQRPIWILLFVLVSALAQPVYWWLYLRPSLDTVPRQ